MDPDIGRRGKELQNAELIFRNGLQIKKNNLIIAVRPGSSTLNSPIWNLTTLIIKDLQNCRLKCGDLGSEFSSSCHSSLAFFLDLREENNYQTMRLTRSFEKYRHNQLQVIELTCRVNNEEDIHELSYDDFEAWLFINGKKIADISYVLGAAGVLVDMVDDVDWHKVYEESMYERKPDPQLVLFH